MKKHKILFSGGGTGGSVSPLLAIAEKLKRSENYEFFWIGTKDGIEKEMVVREDIGYYPIYSGKLRRYFSLRNFFDLLNILFGLLQSLYLLTILKPDLVISAGAYVSVPVAWAAWILRIPVLIHQLDFQPGLANKLISPLAKKITVTFEKSIKDYGQKAVWTGSPVRQNFLSINKNPKTAGDFNLKNSLPVVLVIGGGTGSIPLNKLVWESLDELVGICQIIHLTGKAKGSETEKNNLTEAANKINYISYEFLNIDMLIHAYSAADLVISRCGMGVLTELAYLGKASILIPLPESHQESNAMIFKENNAAIVLKQTEIDRNKFITEIKNILADASQRKSLTKNIQKIFKPNAGENLLTVINELLR